MPKDESLKLSKHTISPQKHSHQSRKHLRDKYALTPDHSPEEEEEVEEAECPDLPEEEEEAEA